MHQKGIPSLKGGRGWLFNKLISFCEHYNGLPLYFITNSYLLLAYFSVGFLYILVQKMIFSILTHNPKKLCRKRVDPSRKRLKWLKLHPHSKTGRGQMIISPLCDDIISCNFTDGCPRARSLGIREHFLKFLNLTKLLALQRWLTRVPT